MTVEVKVTKIICDVCGKKIASVENILWAQGSHCEEMGRTSGECCEPDVCCSEQCFEKARESSAMRNCRKN